MKNQSHAKGLFDHRLWCLIIAVSLALGCPKSSPDQITYKTGVIGLGLAFTARGFCSCLFVVQNDEESCRQYASLKQVNPKLTINWEEKSTASSLFYIFKEKAQYLGPELGCQLVKLKE